MVITEFGTENQKTILLLPGTCCTWEINFRLLVPPLSEEFRVLCVNYTGWDGSGRIFAGMTEETEKIETYIIENFSGHLTAVYGSSMGGSFASLLVQRERVHFDHVFIGSSDLDQASPLAAKIETALVWKIISGIARNPKRIGKLEKKLKKKNTGWDEEDPARNGLKQDYLQSMLSEYFRIIAGTDPRSGKNQFYSDLVTRVEDGIDIEGTAIHVFYAKKMGEKYLRRYYRHYARPDILEFDAGHEGWLADPDLMITVFRRCIDGGTQGEGKE